MPQPLRRLLHFQERGLVLIILALGTLLTVFGGTVRQRTFSVSPSGERTLVMVEKNKFLNAQNLAQLAKDSSFIAIMAVGMSVVIISGGIDLSVGAIFALASVLGAIVLHRLGPEGPSPPSPGMATLIGAAVCVGVGAGCGLANGALTVALRVHPFIITLGMMAILRGIAFVATGGQSIGGFPSPLRDIVRFGAGNGLALVPFSVLIVVTAAGSLFLSRLAAGRRVYAIGGNELASRYSGIRVEKVKLGVFLLSGLTAGVAALLSLGYYGAATSGDGQGYELTVIAAAVVGGASLAGGKGTALGAMLGAIVIQMIDSGIVILGIDQNYSQIVIGAVVILAVVLDNLNSRFARRKSSS